jgi:hypothetical protein
LARQDLLAVLRRSEHFVSIEFAPSVNRARLIDVICPSIMSNAGSATVQNYPRNSGLVALSNRTVSISSPRCNRS